MARRATVSIAGLDQLRRQLDEVPEQITEGARQAVDEGSEAVRDQVRDTVRVDKGNLKAGIRVREIGTAGLTADVGWFGEDEYYAKFNEFGTESIEADPVLTRAGEAERTRFASRVSEEVREELGNL